MKTNRADVLVYPAGRRSRPNGSPAIASVCSAQSQRPSRRTQVDASDASSVTGPSGMATHGRHVPGGAANEGSTR